MSDSKTKIKTGLVVEQSGTLTPHSIELASGGTAGTKTTIQGSQTTDKTLTLPDATDTLVGKATTDTLTNKSIDADTNTITNIENADIKAAAAIDATKIADGSVTNIEFQYLANVTSDIQTQLGSNATAISDHLADTIDAHDASAISSVASGNLAATDVQTALNELQSDIDTRATSTDLSNHINDITDAHDASAISNVPAGNLLATDVQAALNELQGDIDTNATGLSNHLSDTTDAHDASAISNVPSGNLAATDVQGALNELQTDVDTRATSSALTTHTSASTGVHGVTGSVLGTTDTQVVTNKDVDGGTASNTSRITLPKAAKTTLDGLTRKQGTILYDTTSNKPYYDDGTNLKVIGSGSGGVTNFITNGDAETGTTGWTGYKASTPFSTSDVDTTNDTIQFINHGYVTGTPIVFSTTGTLPSPLVVGTTYYAINNDNNHVKVSATLGGSAIDLTTTGSGTGTLGPLVPLNYGGTPTVTLTTTSTNPLVGTNSFLYAKDAANRAGDGHYYAFTIDSAYKAKVLTIDMEYIIASDTFVAGTSSTNSDVTVWIFDVTNSVWIQPSSYRFYSNSSTISDKFQATFQTSSNSTSYRLYLHTSSASTSAYALEFDNVTVSPSVYTYGTPVTDWQAYTPTITGLGTGSNEGFFYRRVGDSIEIKGTYATGTTTASVLSIGLPSGLSVDSSKNPSTTNTASHGVVYNTTHTTTGFASTNVGPYPVFSDTSVSSTVLYVADTNSGSRFNKANGSTLFTTGDRMRFEVKGLPISGFSSSVQMSSDADTRVVDFVGYKAANEAVTANVTNVAYSSSKDSHGTWNGTQYNIPVTGDYNVTVGGSSSAGASINIYVNGSLVKELYTMNASTNTSASTVIPNLKTGDLLSIRSGASVTLNGAAASTNPNSLTISRISGPVTIAATERISCRYTSTAGGSIGTSATQQSFATKTFDTHGSWNGNTFTVQSSGEYEVSAALLTADVTLTTGQSTSLLLYKNGSSYSILDRRLGNGTLGNITLTGTDSIECVSGDTISIYALSQVATSQNTASGYNYVSIKRVK